MICNKHEICMAGLEEQFLIVPGEIATGNKPKPNALKPECTL